MKHILGRRETGIHCQQTRSKRIARERCSDEKDTKLEGNLEDRDEGRATEMVKIRADITDTCPSLKSFKICPTVETEITTVSDGVLNTCRCNLQNKYNKKSKGHREWYVFYFLLAVVSDRNQAD